MNIIDKQHVPHLIALIALIAVIILGILFFLKDSPAADNQAQIIYATKEVH